MKAGTTRGIHSILSGAFAAAWRWEWTDRNPPSQPSRLAYLMIHQLEIDRHDYVNRRITRLFRVAQSRHVHRLDRKEYQSHARTAVLSRCPLYTLNSVDDDK